MVTHLSHKAEELTVTQSREHQITQQVWGRTNSLILSPLLQAALGLLQAAGLNQL